MRLSYGRIVSRHEELGTVMDRSFAVSVLKRLSTTLIIAGLVIAALSTSLLGAPVSVEWQTTGDNQGTPGLVSNNGNPVVVTPSAIPHAVGGNSSQSATKPDSGRTGEGETRAVYRSQHTEEVVARVNGLPITASRFMETRTVFSENLTWMRDVVSRIVPDEQMGKQFWELADPDSPIPESSGLREELGKQMSLIETHGIDAAALADLIIWFSALYRARETGYSPTAEVGSLVEKQRTDFLYGLRPDLDKHVSTYGFDVFFDEVLTEAVTERLTIDSWTDELVANRKSHEEGVNIIDRWNQALVDTAQVVIVDAAAVGTTIEKAIAFVQLDRALTPPLPEPICANGTAVADPIDNRPLVDDCGTLLAAKDTLRGTANLDWSASTLVTDWEGITARGTPSRITKIEVAGESLSGTIPVEISLLSELTHLNLSNNSLTGDILMELSRLYNLELLKLSGNSLTGCVPLHWRDITTNDLSSLNLPYCAPPPPDSFSIGTPMETSVTASWSAAAGASKYRVEYWSKHSAGLGVDDGVTGTTHTVEGLTCDTRYQFWVRAQGDGTTYADGWSAPSRGRLGATTECLTPAFHEETYAFEVLARTANTGSVVGRVSATDPNGDTVTYSITTGNGTGNFAINGSTGVITVAGRSGGRHDVIHPDGAGQRREQHGHGHGGDHGNTADHGTHDRAVASDGEHGGGAERGAEGEGLRPADDGLLLHHCDHQ